MLQKNNYLLIAEVYNKGYIIGFQESIEVAEKTAEELFEKYNLIINEIETIASKEFNHFESYKLNENTPYFGNSSWLRSNGAFTVIIVKITSHSFCLKTFMAERANFSQNLNFEENEEAITGLDNLFPDSFLIAN